MSDTSHISPSAIGSDVSRSRRQLLARKIAKGLVFAFGLNRSGLIATETVQAINPVLKIATPYGPLLCRGGHGRLVWRADTFFTEEPATIPWLDSIGKDDVYWDIGANVGLYAIYVAKFRGCTTLAFEPEAQNYALLMTNLVLNGLNSKDVRAACIAISDTVGIGELKVRYLTQGGAYNLFRHAADSEDELPESFKAAGGDQARHGFRQLVYGASIDDLVINQGFPVPTHIKIDVDGNEPLIIAGCAEVLKMPKLRSLLVEVNKKSPADLAIVDILKSHGFKVSADVSVWDSKPERSRKDLMPAANIIFDR